MNKDIENMLDRLRKIVKTPKEEIMILPWGNSEPEEVIDWLCNLSNEEFELLMQTPIIIQAKIHYSKVRKIYK